ncbi:hypothetical protein TREMEDRAFT_42047 [Tremella mesenterica DSM 1558]|uniref:uncharacterized protein n=1 Tax=Tremella mesenterica (strain ATCC 24925 / CBS 8224 / DSM 1558 / NBRC 9311 / NRRL Y-6157 / RJB 2259-6 / UBC 559-6) TaxID=578456 RepID=UPI0003F48E25|nr:uncharacterized protein TREMEDRAFT_42047 [Tremella mesenterica DSM 1558]EIW72870.1 hypothetical protein TREMEDRAFT_42047 [Tremella mesenterica DSM 1558]
MDPPIPPPSSSPHHPAPTELLSSPTPTIRSKQPTLVRPSLPLSALTSPDNAETSNSGSGTRIPSGSVEQQQGLGNGRPTKPSIEIHLTIPRHSANVSPTRSIQSTLTDDDYESRYQSMSAIPPGMNEQTPRAGSGLRGQPHTAVGSSYGSPDARHVHGSSAGSTGPRAARIVRNHTSTAHPVSYPLNPANASFNANNYGSMARSVSKTRPPLPRNVSGGLGAETKQDKTEQDDEAAEMDRGIDLIRRRQIARRAARRAKKQEDLKRRFAAGETPPELSAPPSALLGEAFGDQQLRTGRSVSRTRASSTQGRRLPSAGYFDTMSTAGSRDGTASPYDEMRAASIYSSTEDEEEYLQDVMSALGDEVPEDYTPGVGVEEEEARVDRDEGSVDDEEDASGEGDDEAVTMRDRQDAINIEHPFGLPIWKPALYRKSRTVTRNAESALHSIPSAAAERHLLPGNIFWVLAFGWWLSLLFLVAAILVGGAEVLGGGRGGYAKTLRGLSWYIVWPFGKYVEGEGAPDGETSVEGSDHEGTENGGHYGAVEDPGSPLNGKQQRQREASDGAGSIRTLRPGAQHSATVTTSDGANTPTNDSGTTVRPRREPTVTFATDTIRTSSSRMTNDSEGQPLLSKEGFRRPRRKRAKFLGRLVYWPAFLIMVAPVMLIVCILCWGGVITIPMAKLTWALLKLLYFRPLEINFRSAPHISVPTPHESPVVDEGVENPDLSGSSTAVADNSSPSGFTMKQARLHAGQLAPTAGPDSTVLLCTYRAVGLQYYKYTVGGVNIIFINLLPLVFFTIFDGFVLLRIVEHGHKHGHMPSPFMAAITNPGLIFVLALASVIPLSYFIGMAVASISAQSSIGVGATINATFGSIIEVILYGIALTQGKGKLVEGSIIGSILAGVLLMPGASMCSGAVRRKEQKFNAKSAGVTSTMLIMAIIGTLTPTLFYQTYGSFELHCEGCPGDSNPGTAPPTTQWQCDHCYYEHPDPANDTFYQEKVKILMYFCAVILCLSYFIGCLFSLKTHAAQIWTDPKPLMRADEISHLHPAVRQTLRQRITPEALLQHVLPMHRDGSSTPRHGGPQSPRATVRGRVGESLLDRRAASGPSNLPAGYTPLLEAITQKIKQESLTPMRLPSSLTAPIEERDEQQLPLVHKGSIISNVMADRHAPNEAEAEEEGGGHEGPSWTRDVSTAVLLGCTVLYAGIAEVLVDVVDVVLQGSGIDEKFLGLTLFALVPNTTEFMNAMSFALNGNIALSMEIGSAYALQVCLVQIPFLVAFSAFYDPRRMGEGVDTFTLIFPRWDVIAIILSIFLLTYTYIEARANYHRGSILVLSYLVLIMGFYFAPPRTQEGTDTEYLVPPESISLALSTAGKGIKAGLTKLWA